MVGKCGYCSRDYPTFEEALRCYKSHTSYPKEATLLVGDKDLTLLFILEELKKINRTLSSLASSKIEQKSYPWPAAPNIMKPGYKGKEQLLKEEENED